MKQLLFKIAALGLFGIFCAFLISEARVSSPLLYDEDSMGKYAFQSTGDLSQYLDGKVNFESLIQIDDSRHSTSILKLKLDSEENGLPHTVEFLISQENTNKPVSKGSYLISQDPNGFLNNFDGVFGFANINSLGELPFFAKSGEVRLDFVDDFMVKGMLNVNLRNGNGKSINLEGDFVALK